MATEPEASVFLEDSGMTRANERTVASEEQSPAALRQIFAVLIQIWPRDLAAATDANVVSTVGPATAAVPIDEQVVKIIVTINEGRLYSVCLLYTSDAADERSSVDLG